MDTAIKAASPPPPAGAPSAARRRPPRHLWFVILTAIVGPTLALVYAGVFGDLLPGQALVFDHWMFTGLVALGCAVALLFWFVILSGYPWAIRWKTLAVLVVVAAVGCVAASPFYKFVGFTGGMIPRWERVTGALPVPEGPKTTEGASRVDLATTTPNDFPQFMGPNRDNRLMNVHLAADWGTSPPKLLWKLPIGEGWAGFAVVGDHAVTMQQRDQEEWTTCHKLKTGEIVWKNAIAGRHSNVLGGIGPRSTPTIDGGRVYVMHAIGTLRCLDGADGKTLWEHDLLKDFDLNQATETNQTSWGRSASPLIFENAVIVPAGGPAGKAVTLVAYDKVTGAKLWQGGQRTPGYASPSLAVIDGVPQILMVSEDFMGSYDAKTGELLWEVDWQGSSSGNANVSNPRQIGPDQIFLSKGYGIGAKLMQVTRKDGKWTTTKLWHNNRTLRTKFSNVVFKDGYGYGLSEAYLECGDLKTGKKRWTGSRFGYGQILGVGDDLLVLSEEGEVALVAMSPFTEDVRAKFQAIDGITWNPPALAGKYLLVRNAREAACYEMPLAP